MSRDQKLSLIIGFSVLLVVGMLISDHVSKERRVSMQEVQPEPVIALDFKPVFVPAEPESPQRSLPPRAEPAEQERQPQPPAPEADRQEPFEPLHIRMGEAIMAGPGIGPEQPSVDPEPARASPAASGAADPEPGIWYIVGEGQTLYGICQDYYGDGEVWRKLIVHNPGRVSAEGHVRAGNRIFLPGRATLGLPPAPSRPADPAPRPAPSSPQDGRVLLASERTYVVQKDDCLGTIAQRLLGTVRRQQEIIDLNRDQIRDADQIRVGMVLRIPAR